MNKRFSGSFCYRALIMLVGVVLVFSVTAWRQQSPAYNHSTAIDQADSRAEQEAERMVSLSADTILSILRQEPGLLLQVKKALVRRACLNSQ
jgi:hypothetical protein